MYAPACPAQPPFSAAFVAAFRTAQIARNRRISAWAQNLLSRLRDRPDGDIERASVIHRTMCDVRRALHDATCAARCATCAGPTPTVDRNGRRPSWSYRGDPLMVNFGPVGPARCTTLRSWLSHWSYDLSRARGPPSPGAATHQPGGGRGTRQPGAEHARGADAGQELYRD